MYCAYRNWEKRKHSQAFKLYARVEKQNKMTQGKAETLFDLQAHNINHRCLIHAVHEYSYCSYAEFFRSFLRGNAPHQNRRKHTKSEENGVKYYRSSSSYLYVQHRYGTYNKEMQTKTQYISSMPWINKALRICPPCAYILVQLYWWIRYIIRSFLVVVSQLSVWYSFFLNFKQLAPN